MEQRDICMLVMFIIIIIMFFQIQNISKNNNYENITNTSQITDAQLTAINNQISSIYNMDVEAIRNLGSISKSLLTGTNYHSTTVGTPGELTIPADNTQLKGNLNVTGNTVVNGNTNLIGILDVNGKQLIPPGIIMAWYQPVAPAGWGLCNGTLYGTIQSPDLRGRFIKMAHIGTGIVGEKSYNITDNLNRDINATYRNGTTGIIRNTLFGVTGGSDYRVLDYHEMPRHSHQTRQGINEGSSGGTTISEYANNTDGSWKWGQVSDEGWNYGHGVNSPYYTLVYIIYIG